MIRMIADTELLFDQAGHAPRRPNLAAKAVGFGPFEQQGGQERLLLAVQQGGGAGGGMVTQGLDTGSGGPLQPLANRPLGDGQGLGNLLLRPAVLVQLPGAPPPPFVPTHRWRVLSCTHKEGTEQIPAHNY